MSAAELPIAHRVWAERMGLKAKPSKRSGKSRPPKVPGLLVFDTETTTDATQALLFGAWRYYGLTFGQALLLDEGLFYADELPCVDPQGFEELQLYVGSHSALLGNGRTRPIRLLSCAEFIEKVFFRSTYDLRARVVGFNLPFDLSRLAIRVAEGRGANRGGFSAVLAKGKEGTEHTERRHRPRVDVKHVDSKLAFLSLTKPMNPDEIDLIPEDSDDGLPDPQFVWRGRFLDLRTFAFALTGSGLSLEKACKAFGVEGKADSGEHGRITEKYIDYCRQDVAATFALYEALMDEFDRHPVAIEPERAYSPASLAKAYLKEMGIEPLLERHPSFPRDSLVMPWEPSSGEGRSATSGGCPCR